MGNGIFISLDYWRKMGTHTQWKIDEAEEL